MDYITGFEAGVQLAQLLEGETRKISLTHDGKIQFTLTGKGIVLGQKGTRYDDFADKPLPELNAIADTVPLPAGFKPTTELYNEHNNKPVYKKEPRTNWSDKELFQLMLEMQKNGLVSDIKQLPIIEVVGKHIPESNYVDIEGGTTFYSAENYNQTMGRYDLVVTLNKSKLAEIVPFIEEQKAKDFPAARQGHTANITKRDPLVPDSTQHGR